MIRGVWKCARIRFKKYKIFPKGEAKCKQTE